MRENPFNPALRLRRFALAEGNLGQAGKWHQCVVMLVSLLEIGQGLLKEFGGLGEPALAGEYTTTAGERIPFDPRIVEHARGGAADVPALPRHVYCARYTPSAFGAPFVEFQGGTAKDLTVSNWHAKCIQTAGTRGGAFR